MEEHTRDTRLTQIHGNVVSESETWVGHGGVQRLLQQLLARQLPPSTGRLLRYLDGNPVRCHARACMRRNDNRFIFIFRTISPVLTTIPIF